MFKLLLRNLGYGLLAAFVLTWSLHSAPQPAHAQAQAVRAALIRAGKLNKAGDHAGALRHAERARRLFAKRFGRRHKDYRIIQNALVRIHNEYSVSLYKAGKFDQAETQARKGLSIGERWLGKRHGDVAESVNNLAVILEARGHYYKAEPLHNRALKIRERQFGKNHRHVALSLNNLANNYYFQGRYNDAVPLLKRALAIREKVLGKNHTDVAQSLNNLAELHNELGLYSKAEPLYKRSLAIHEKVHGKNHPDVATSLNNLANFYKDQGRFSEAAGPLNRSLAIRRKALGKEHVAVGASLNNLADLFQRQGRYAEAETLHKQALAILEKALGPDHPNVAASLNSLAHLYEVQDRHADAEPLVKRSLAIREKSLGGQHPVVAISRHNLAEIYRVQGRFDDAEQLFKRALTVLEKSYGSEHAGIAVVSNNLANLYEDQGRLAEAEKLLKRDLSVSEKALGPFNPHVAVALGDLARVYVRQGRLAEAEPLYKRALLIGRKAYGENHPFVANSLKFVGLLDARLGRLSGAYDKLRRAAAIHESRSLAGSAQRNAPRGETASQANIIFRELAGAAWYLAQEDHKRREELTGAAFKAVQWVGSTSTQAALGQMAARAGAKNAKLATRVRARQDLVQLFQSLDKKLLKAIGQPSAKQDAKLVDVLRSRLAAVSKRLADSDVLLARDFPEYAELANPKPLQIEQVQALLKPDEALVLYHIGYKRSLIWVVARDSATWELIEQGKTEFEQQVGALRKSLDPVAAAQTSGEGLSREQDCAGLAPKNKPCESDETVLGQAHGLYNKLLGPVANALEDKRHLIIVPSGPLTSLPFNALVTAPPPGDGKLEDRLKKTQWLVRRHAVTILPSVSSLRALRVFAIKGRASRPFIGFGDPEFFRPQDKGKGGPKTRTVQAMRGYAAYFRGARADLRRLSGAIPPLPDTADELRAVAKIFNAGQSDIILGRKASESTIKAMSGDGRLTNYQIVHFATHGLIAGQIRGLGEPALVFSLPQTPTELDDGLLTASEVAQLKLNADWVVLSACNTAAGDKPGAEAFSGLARAFFYSGTRALLVSHWPVISEAAVKLTTKAFNELNSDQAIGRAEALRRSMVELIDKGAPHEVHPAYWAPFVVVGEGGRL